ncbi:MAG: hypothetical protein DMG14_11945 [Acidobacteria bacterium]|nr:MAG: hypothetical protein DMG14_11945 [Acidobacteriota bacterium]
MNQSRSTVLVLILLLFIVAILPLSAQNFTADARLVAMGGTGGHANDALRLCGLPASTALPFLSSAAGRITRRKIGSRRAVWE